MSTYYQYQDVEELIVHRLIKLAGWDVGYFHETEIDGMTDYYNPFYWCGIAKKGAYKFVFNKSTAKEARTYTRTHTISGMDAKTRKMIEKLSAMTIERGATPAEAETATKKIELLKAKATDGTRTEEEIIIEDSYMANPPRCNWHIEKDGIILEKGTGILKFANVPDITRESELKEWQKFNNLSKEEFIKEYIQNAMWRNWYNSEEQAESNANSYYDNLVEKYKLLDQFSEWINKINNICGGMVGGSGASDAGYYEYEEIIKTEYKTEIKAKETTTGSVEDGQCFILKCNFNYGRHKNYVYKIYANKYDDGSIIYGAYKMNGKNTKTCTGNANKSNHWFIGSNPELLTKWIDKGSIAWCELVEEKTPYEVKKTVKKYIKPETSKTNEQPKTTAKKENSCKSNNYNFNVEKSEHTKTHEIIYLVKVLNKLDREQYNTLNAAIKENGGYYSKFTHSFIFKDEPTEILNNLKMA